MPKKTLFWFRQDLRIADNPGLHEAAIRGQVLAVYIFDDSHNDFKLGNASRWWLHHSLQQLNKTLHHALNIYQGDSLKIIQKLIKEHEIDTVYWNNCYEPWRVKNDTAIKLALTKAGVDCKTFNASLLWEPWTTTKEDKTPYKVFTPFYKKASLHSEQPRTLLSAPQKLQLIKDSSSEHITALQLLSRIKDPTNLKKYWTTGEDAAQTQWNNFVTHGLSDYQEGRNFPAQAHVSRMSPYLHFGEISPHQLRHSLHSKSLKGKILHKNIDCFLKELGWREFSYHLLYHFPNLPKKNFQEKFDNFPWLTNNKHLEAWQQGQTGYPIVDAGMRELLQTGYMHNRVRMIVGSFLVKNLLLHWHHGEDWFWQHLVDADLANNSASWQWVAGSGADAAPYFRIFNPVTQGKNFDPEGLYTKQFVPELTKMPISHLFRPWEATPAILSAAGVILGKNYPRPIVDLTDSRKRALAAFKAL